ncbi:hypothetical protein IVG45_01115 [Methylomonas sp. LL1]|uniref:hypothetical protein n=1 Tax=Methylomonas sp. LL1 TaxID=2785785 RepID=UPI0018C3D764|nr:hypothetical protein [Methylomonas sp. LL1]QPK63615.1 hypothetical protein IVG45_01115 [Methylomonas sp. LL1]
MLKNTLRNIAYTAACLTLSFKMDMAGAAIVTFDPLNPVYAQDEAPVTIKIVGRDFVGDTSSGATQGSMGGGLSVSWDASILKLTTVTSLFAGDEFFGDTGAINNVNGTLTGFSVSSFFTGTTAANFDIAELVFDFVQPGWSDTSISISGIDVWADGSGLVDVTPLGIGGSVTVTPVAVVTPVPVPPALVLFGSSLLGMMCLGRRKSYAV